MRTLLVIIVTIHWMLRAFGAEHLEYSFARGNEVYDCHARRDFSETVVGQVMTVDHANFELDLCLPTADCNKPRVVRMTIHFPGLSNLTDYMAPNTFVRAAFDTTISGKECRQRLFLKNLDTWLGDRNLGSQFFLVGLTEGAEPFLDAPYKELLGDCSTGLEIIRSADHKRFVLSPSVTTSLDNDAAESWAGHLISFTPKECGARRLSYWIAAKHK